MAIGVLQFPLAARSAAPPPSQDATPPLPVLQGTPSPRQEPPPVESAPPPSQGAPARAASNPTQRTFAVMEYDVEGNTLLKPIDIERAVTPYLGEGRTIKDIDSARGALEKVYHDLGYKTVLVNIPEQQISSGVVRLRVLEAPVGKLRITGSQYHSLGIIRDKLVELNQGNVPNFTEVQKELGDVNRSPDLRVAPVLKASETPGKVDVDLRVTDELPLHAIVETDNRYSSNTSHTRVTGELRYDNLFQRNQSISLQYQVAPTQISDAKVASVSYVIPTSSGPVWALYAVHSDSNIAAVGDLNVIGKGNIFGARFITPLPVNGRDYYHNFTAGVDYKDFKQTVVLQGATDTVDTPVSYPLFSLDYSGTWLGSLPPEGHRDAATLGGRSSSTSLDFGISFAIRGLAMDREEFAAKRANASTSFIVLRPSITHEQVLFKEWSAVLKLDGQLASGPLINNEEYSGGGADSVRGYTESERLGDEGARVSVELRSPQLLAHRFTKVDQSYVFLFADGAKLFVLEPLPKQEATFTLASAGIGLRFKAYGLTVSLDGAHTFKNGYVTPAGRMRGLFKLSYAY
jgi:hemolysin activation/secretion protein